MEFEQSLIWIKKKALQLSSGSSIVSELALSALILLVFLFVGKIYSGIVRSNSESTLEERRAKLVTFRNTLGVIYLILFIMIWGGELRSLILSITAILAAILLVSKEFIANFLGGVLFIISKPAKIGDSIEVQHYKGELLDINWTYFSLLEVSSSKRLNGKILKIPNSVLLSNSISRAYFVGEYKPTVLSLLVDAALAHKAHGKLEQIAQEHTESIQKKVQEEVLLMQNDHLVDIPNALATCSFIPKDKDTVELQLRFFQPAQERSKTEQKILEDYYAWLQEEIKKKKEAEALLFQQKVEAIAQNAIAKSPVQEKGE